MKDTAPDKITKIDLGIITIRDDEFKAVLSVFPKETEISMSRRYNIARAVTLDSSPLSVAVLKCNEEGTGEAQDATRDLIEDLSPACVIVVGIAGGYPSQEFTLGDVVVSTRVHDFTLEAAVQGRPREYQVTGGPLKKEITSLVANIAAMEGELGDWALSIRTKISRPILTIPIPFSQFYGPKSWKEKVRNSLATHFKPGRSVPIIFPGPFASSDRLVKDTAVAQRFHSAGARKVIAIEMEIAGCYRACHSKDIPCLSIRGISDIVGLKRDPAWTAYACASAAAFTKAFAQTGKLPRHLSKITTQANVINAPAKTAPPAGVNTNTSTNVLSQDALKGPTEVFTPRNPYVNESMYIERPDLEIALWNAFRGSQHVFVHGESGTGKSWLYKRVLARQKVYVAIANLANASRLNSIVGEIASLAIGSGALHSGDSDQLGLSFSELRRRAGQAPCCLVLDNLEAIFSKPNLMSELADIIMLLDDERYSTYKIKLIIVGVPSDVRTYFNKTPNRQTVANRIKEVPEVSRLSHIQVGMLVRRGFIDELKVNIAGFIDRIVNHVNWVTTGIPQRVHEYCLELAFLCERQGMFEPGMLIQADHNWLQASLSSSYTAIHMRMNDRETKVGRRNQILYALGLVQMDDFRSGDVEDIVRREFPVGTKQKTLNISGLLSALAEESEPLIRRTLKGDQYEFTDPKWRMCLRAMLYKDPEGTERVFRRDMSGVSATH